MGRIALLACCLVAGLATGASSAAAQLPPPPAQALASGWEFRPDPLNLGIAEGLPAGANAGGLDWTPVTVPHVFDPRPLDSLFKGTIGWYRVTFQGPETPPGFSWALRFEQVRRVARVWLNGRELGSNDDPYAPFTLPTRGLRVGEPNTLVVRVDNRKGKEPREGWWNWGGITRPVTLVPLGRLVLHDVGLLPRLHCTAAGCAARVIVDGWLTNRSPQQLTPVLSVSLAAPGTGALTRRVVGLEPLVAGGRERVTFAVRVPGPVTLWSPERPALYDATVTTRGDTEIEQVDRAHVGMRTVRVTDGMLHVNGRTVTLHGASIQEDVEGHGPALTDEDMNRIVAELKAVHANVTRAHYLLNPALLDRLDAAGIMVWNQAPIYHRDVLLRTPAERETALQSVRRTVLAVRNHPSVIVNSIANELRPQPDHVPSTRAFVTSAVRLVRSLDATRPVALDVLSYPGFPRQRTYGLFDVLGINNYFGWYPGKARHSTARLADLRPYLLRMRRLYPRQAMVMTEFGAESTMPGPRTEKETYAFQSDYIRHTLSIVHSLPFMGGAIYWTLQEFAVKPQWDGGAKRDVPRDSIHNKGLITYDGALKPAWRVAEELFAATPSFRATPRRAVQRAHARSRHRA